VIVTRKISFVQVSNQHQERPGEETAFTMTRLAAVTCTQVSGAGPQHRDSSLRNRDRRHPAGLPGAKWPLRARHVPDRMSNRG
jgi:hypothetical protein